MPIIKIVNATTGEEIEREMNAEELAQWEADKVSAAAEEAAAQAKAEAKASAEAKLAVLGLTADEIAALSL